MRIGRKRTHRTEDDGRHGSRNRFFDAGQLRLIVLQSIAVKPSHGYDIIKALEERFGGVYSPSPGVIYPTLSLLEDQGLVTVEAAGAKKLYTVTPEGNAILKENRSFIDAINARLNSVADRKGRGHYPELRKAMHDLKHVVLFRLQSGPVSSKQAHQMEAIIQHAAEEIKNL
jgi:DNA-binding PadR family transcriptional regulator